MFNQEAVPEPAAAAMRPQSDQLSWHDLPLAGTSPPPGSSGRDA